MFVFPDNNSIFFASYIVKGKFDYIVVLEIVQKDAKCAESEDIMKKKTKALWIACMIAVIILLFPICLRLKDGGSRVYRSIAGIYEVKSWKQMGYTEEGYATQKTGITVKLFGMKIFDSTKTEMEAKTGESSGMDTFSVISTENFPVDMSAEEMLAKAVEENFVVMENFQFLSGEEQWKEFVETAQAGNPAVVYLAHYYTLNKEQVSEELYEQEKEEYPKIFLVSLHFDGEKYTITDRPGYEEQPVMVRTYPYLVKFEGEPSSTSAVFDRYEYYVLVHDKNVTWEELEWGTFSSQMGDYIDHCRVVSKHIKE